MLLRYVNSLFLGSCSREREREVLWVISLWHFWICSQKGPNKKLGMERIYSTMKLTNVTFVAGCSKNIETINKY